MSPRGSYETTEALAAALEEAVLTLGRTLGRRDCLGRVQALLEELQAEQAVLEARVERESSDVERLGSWSWDWMSAALKGRVTEQLDKERREALAAGFHAMAHATVVGEVIAVEQDLAETEVRTEARLQRLWARTGRRSRADVLTDAVEARRAWVRGVQVNRALDVAEAAREHFAGATDPELLARGRGRFLVGRALAGERGGRADIADLQRRTEQALSGLRSVLFSAQPPDLQPDPTWLEHALTLRRDAIRSAERRRELAEQITQSRRKERRQAWDVSALQQAHPARWASIWVGSWEADRELKADRHEAAIRERVALEAQLAAAEAERVRLGLAIAATAGDLAEARGGPFDGIVDRLQHIDRLVPDLEVLEQLVHEAGKLRDIVMPVAIWGDRLGSLLRHQIPRVEAYRALQRTCSLAMPEVPVLPLEQALTLARQYHQRVQITRDQDAPDTSLLAAARVQYTEFQKGLSLHRKVLEPLAESIPSRLDSLIAEVEGALEAL